MKKSKHGHSNNGQESWGRDSGARDLSPDMHRHNSSGTSQMTENEPGGMDQLQTAAVGLSTMRSEVVEVSQRLQRSEHRRNILEQQLRDLLQDRDRIQRQMENMSATHESRVTEMHCVIVELSKKLKTKDDGVIAEEPEGSVSELSFQDGSVYNSDMDEVLAIESETEPLDIKLEQQDKQSANASQTSFSNLLSAPNFLPDSRSLNHIDVLQDEVLHLRAQVALLESQLAATKQTDHSPPPAVALGQIEAKPSLVAAAAQPDNIPTGSSPPVAGPVSVIASHGVPVVPKMAERVKLKRTNLDGYHKSPDIEVDAELTGQLVADLYEDVAVASPELQLLEVKQLQRRIEYLKVQNTILLLTLAESKQHCDHLFLLCGKYESNAIALQQALSYSDRAIEAYDVMLALFESRLDIVQNNPGGLKNKEDAENVAKHLLNHLERDTNVQSTSLGPWQDAILLYSEKSKDELCPWTKEDDFRLRSHISKLKGNRASVQGTVVQLESPFYTEINPSTIHDESPASTKRMDLETAVLMQELMNLTQEVTLFKSRAEKAEQEKRVSEEQLKALQEALIQVQAQMNDGCSIAAGLPRDRVLYSEVVEPSAEMERELVDALARESRLKARLQGLAGSVEAATKSSKEKYSQLQELRAANQTLNDSLEKHKRKYEAKVKRLESQLHEMSLRCVGGVDGRKSSLPSPRSRLGGDQNNAMTSSVTMCNKQQRTTQPLAQHVPETTL